MHKLIVDHAYYKAGLARHGPMYGMIGELVAENTIVGIGGGTSDNITWINVFDVYLYPVNVKIFLYPLFQ